MTSSYRLLPFEFKRKANGEVLLVNECGDFVFLSPDDFRNLSQKQFGAFSFIIESGRILYTFLDVQIFIQRKRTLFPRANI